MMTPLSAPRGTHDILPDELPLWVELETNARKVLKIHGYREIRTPVYESTALFCRSLGETSDIVNKQLLNLATDKDEGLSLRPEGTAAIVRSYLENGFEGREPLTKLFYLGPMFRGERPQKGRLRQFHQIGAEAIGPGSTSPFLDAEMIILAARILESFGIKDYRVNLNTLGSREDKGAISEFLRQRLASERESLCEDCRSRFERNVFRVLDCKKEGCRRVVGAIGELPLSDPSRTYFEQVQKCLRDLKVPFVVAPHLVRGLDYYTHTVFEITATGLGSQDAVGAGGRYNGLLHELGGDEKKDYGAIGFALGMERIILASGRSALPTPELDAFVVSMDPSYLSTAFVLLNELRGAGRSANLSYTGGSIKSQMRQADKAGAKKVLILGEQEMKDGTVTVKDMTTGEQATHPLNSVHSVLSVHS